MGAIISIVIYFLVAALVIYIVGRLNLGLTVDGYVTAVLAAAVIAIVGGIVYWLIGLFNLSLGGSGICGAIINLIVAAVVLLLSGRVFKGLEVKGFGGAIIAAIAIGVVGWLLYWVLSLIRPGIGRYFFGELDRTVKAKPAYRSWLVNPAKPFSSLQTLTNQRNFAINRTIIHRIAEKRKSKRWTGGPESGAGENSAHTPASNGSQSCRVNAIVQLSSPCRRCHRYQGKEYNQPKLAGVLAE